MKIGTSNGGSQNYESQTVGYDSYKGFDEWDYVEWIGIPAASTLYVSFNESSSNNVNEWYVDDLRVELWYPEETENLLANPNFLTGATGWSFSSTPSGEYTISNNRLNVADTNRTNDAFATQQLFASSMAEGKYRITADYSFSSGGFDAGIGGKRIWTIQGTSSNTWELEAGDGNTNFRLITGQTGVGYFNNVGLFRVAEPKRNNPVPPLGIDEGVTFEGDTKVNTQQYMYFPTGDTSQRSRGRAVFAGGYSGGPSPAGAATANMSYVQVQSVGSVIDFGDLTAARWIPSSGASSTRGTFNGGATPTRLNTIDYVTIATTGDAIDFGDTTTTTQHGTALSNNTRGLYAGGHLTSSPYPTSNHIGYVTIASTGNTTDFGDMYAARFSVASAASQTPVSYTHLTLPTKA